MDLKTKLKNLPSTPGVYLMKDSLGLVIYVGKAKNLKRRVQSYFQNAKSHSPKIEKLVKNIRDIEYILTDTEFEAFLQECKLIKCIKPMFNKKMKNSLAYTFLSINLGGDFPAISITNRPLENDSCVHFGPYTSKGTIQRALQGIKEYYKIACNNPYYKAAGCLNYSIGLCIGMCQGGKEIAEYKRIINQIMDLLQGKDLRILKELPGKMEAAAERCEFETAAKYRDYLQAINFLLNKEKVIEFTEENKNILVLEEMDESMVKIFLIKRNEVLFSEKYFLEQMDKEQLRLDIKAKIFTFFKAQETDTASSVKEVNQEEIDEAQIIYSYLKSNNCQYLIIQDKWLKTGNDDELEAAEINEALDEFLSSVTKRI